jgi:hypothetical protein
MYSGVKLRFRFTTRFTALNATRAARRVVDATMEPAGEREPKLGLSGRISAHWHDLPKKPMPTPWMHRQAKGSTGGAGLPEDLQR